MKILLIVLFSLFFAIPSSQAQYAAQREAMYIATLKAVVDYKIDDEENLRDVEALRLNKRFHRDLTKMLGELSNKRTKNTTNAKVYRILLQAGKDIYNELN